MVHLAGDFTASRPSAGERKARVGAAVLALAVLAVSCSRTMTPSAVPTSEASVGDRAPCERRESGPSGRGSGEAGPSGRGSGEAGPSGSHVTVWHPFEGADRYQQAFAAALAGFQATHPGTVVDAVAINENLVDRLAGVSSPPDMLLIDDDDLGRLVDSGRILAAGDCLDAIAAPLAARLWPLVRETWTLRGRLWVVPYAAAPDVLWFNAERVASTGRPLPRTRVELEAMLVELAARTGEPAMRYDLEVAYLLIDRWAAQRGRPLVEPGPSGRPGDWHVHLDRVEVIEDVTWLRDLDRRGVIRSTGADRGGDDVRALIDPAGKAGLGVQSSGSLGNALEMADRGELDLSIGGIAPLPVTLDGAAEPAPGGLGFAIVDHPGTDPHAAAVLAAHLAAPGTQAAMAARTGLAPVVRGSEDEPVLRAAREQLPQLAVPGGLVRAEPAAGGTGVPRPGTTRELRAAVIAAFRSVVHDGVEPDVAMREAQRIAIRQLELYDRLHP
jgi:ABC-type glycerol-3-phosphate transport system substrate-binding protein